MKRDYAFNMATETSTPVQNSDTKGALGIPQAEFVVNNTIQVQISYPILVLYILDWCCMSENKYIAKNGYLHCG